MVKAEGGAAGEPAAEWTREADDYLNKALTDEASVANLRKAVAASDLLRPYTYVSPPFL